MEIMVDARGQIRRDQADRLGAGPDGLDDR
jgi:hypothetical protein